MAYLRISEARAAGQVARSYVSKTASQILTEDSRRFSSTNRYDVFLSHAYQDADTIHGVRSIIESLGLTVYVDWIDDAGLDRGKVTSKTAQVLRERMKTSSCLVYVHSANAAHSVWMPWELGYFDAFKPSHVWILPLVAESDSEFKGQEYLGLYPPLEKLTTLAQRLDLGFLNVGQERSAIPLAKAASGSGVYYT
jgi:TIR domain